MNRDELRGAFQQGLALAALLAFMILWRRIEPTEVPGADGLIRSSEGPYPSGESGQGASSRYAARSTTRP